MRSSRELGKLGEDVACKYLIKNGHEIECRNYNKLVGELDIVTKKSATIHFVEVKSLRIKSQNKDDAYKPEYNLSKEKQKRLLRTILSYMEENNIKTNWQFDLVCVHLNMQTRRAKVSILENLIISF